MKVRLRPGCNKKLMSTSYGVVTHEWTTVPDNAYVFKEMQVMDEKTGEPVVVAAPAPEPAEVPKPEEKIKKKTPRRRTSRRN